MRQGKHAACEVPSAVTLDECWELVNTAEETQRHFMMLENCCYDFFELNTFDAMMKKYEHPLATQMGEKAKKVGGKAVWTLLWITT